MTWRDILPMNMFGNYLPKGAFDGADRQAAGAAQSHPDNGTGPAGGGGASAPIHPVCYTASKAAGAAGAVPSGGHIVIDGINRQISSALDIRKAAMLRCDKDTADIATDVVRQLVAERDQHLAALRNHQAMRAGQRPSPYPYSPFHDDLPPPALKDGGLTVGEIIGWRCWLYKSGYLRSVYREDLWMPGEPLEAPEAPSDHGEEGIHAWKTRRGAVNYAMEWVDKAPAIIGQVKLYGAVVEHDLGYRAQYATIASVVDAVGAPMPVLATLEDVRARYNVGASWPPPKPPSKESK